MTRRISVRLNEESVRALRILEASGLSQSEAVRSALIGSAQRLRRTKELAAEGATLDADESDREEMLAVAEMMASMRLGAPHRVSSVSP